MHALDIGCGDLCHECRDESVVHCDTYCLSTQVRNIVLGINACDSDVTRFHLLTSIMLFDLNMFAAPPAYWVGSNENALIGRATNLPIPALVH